ncbi:hypothetical protein [Actinoallomurus sp. CA-142502]|uniref:hypothetical protein n=1 Tax=Actinoallomurus sp. CA-142502 TaxID=3239885 RepID=UPI003D8A9BD1
MAGITRVDQVQSASAAAEGARTITLPTLQDDDFVLLAVGLVTASAPAVTVAGWSNDVPLVRPGTSTFRMGLWSKRAVAASDSGATITVSSTVSGEIGVIARAYRGVDTTTAYDVTIGTANSGTADATPDCPSLTPATDGAMVVDFYGMATTTNTNWTDWTPPSGFGTAKTACSTIASVNNAAIGSADLLQATAAATGIMTATAGPAASPQAHPWAAFSIALRPAAAPTPPGNGLWGVHL